jgi:Flp pilus assembly protein TadD
MYQQGNFFFENGNLKDAERSFRRAINLNPRHAFAFANLVWRTPVFVSADAH